MAAARVRPGSSRLVEPTCGWQRGLELIMNGTCPWCFKPIESARQRATAQPLLGPGDAIATTALASLGRGGPLTWSCEGECTR